MKNEVVVTPATLATRDRRFHAMFYQPNAAIRKFKVTGLPEPEGRTGAWSLFSSMASQQRKILKTR